MIYMFTLSQIMVVQTTTHITLCKLVYHLLKKEIILKKRKICIGGH